MGDKKWILGLGGSQHDSSAALMYGTDIKVAIEEERLSRVKHGKSYWFQNPVAKSVEYCLSSENITLDDVSAIVSSDLIPNKVLNAYKEKKIELYRHHQCHAASAYSMVERGAKAGIIVFDGMGSILNQTSCQVKNNIRETICFYTCMDNVLAEVGVCRGNSIFEHDGFPCGCNYSLGMFYEMVTASLGYHPLDAGKTMGLASYGHDRLLDEFMAEIELGDGFSNCLKIDLLNGNLSDIISNFLNKNRFSFDSMSDIAATSQRVFEKVLFSLYEKLNQFDIDVVCLAGGCALNSAANGKLTRHISSKQELVIPPFTGDSGIAIGSLWLYANKHIKNFEKLTFRNKPMNPYICRPGRRYSEEMVSKSFNDAYPRLTQDCSVKTPKDLARIIAKGKIIGVFNGNSEMGPRALGGRSILADPRSVHLRDKINRELKQREPYRPLAPIILEKNYDRYFDNPSGKNPFMLVVAKAKDICCRVAPGIVHIDQSARVQCISKNYDPFLTELLAEFEKITGVPILMNTSFNRKGEPIVETPSDAIDSFLGMNLDGLYVSGNFYLPIS